MLSSLVAPVAPEVFVESAMAPEPGRASPDEWPDCRSHHSFVGQRPAPCISIAQATRQGKKKICAVREGAPLPGRHRLRSPRKPHHHHHAVVTKDLPLMSSM